MKKMEILKNAFESIGYKTKTSYNKDWDIYYLCIEGTFDGDASNYSFCFNKDMEPIEYDDNDNEFRTLQEHYKHLETLYDNEE